MGHRVTELVWASFGAHQALSFWLGGGQCMSELFFFGMLWWLLRERYASKVRRLCVFLLSLPRPLVNQAVTSKGWSSHAACSEVKLGCLLLVQVKRIRIEVLVALMLHELG